MLKKTPFNIPILTKFSGIHREKNGNTCLILTNIALFITILNSQRFSDLNKCHMTMAAQHEIFNECLVPF